MLIDHKEEVKRFSFYDSLRPHHLRSPASIINGFKGGSNGCRLIGEGAQ